MEESPYDRWAGIYDTVYSHVTDDIPFYVEEARRAGGPVLELGCGTGRVAIPVARSGIEIVGLDSSPAMLDRARRKAKGLGLEDTLTFVQADMRGFSLSRLARGAKPAGEIQLSRGAKSFPLVIVPFRGFLSLLTVEDQMRALERIKLHLAPGGRLVFNIFVPDLEMLSQDADVLYHSRDVTDPETGTSFVVWNQSRFDHHNQLVDTRVVLDELDDTGAVAGRLYRDYRLRYVHRWEMHHLLRICGYEVVDLYGDFDRTPFGETSEEMVWVAAVHR